MGIFDDLWVYQYEFPDPIYIAIMIFFHIIVLATIFIMYKVCKNRIAESMNGPSSEATIKPPKNLTYSLKLLFISLALLPLSNTISHASHLLIPQKHSYFMIGSNDVLTGISIAMILMSVVNFIDELDKESVLAKVTIDRKRYVLVILILTLYFIEKIQNFLAIPFESLTIVLVYLILIIVALRSAIVSLLKQTNNELIRIRRSLLLINILLVLAMFFVAAIYAPLGSTMETEWLTRNLSMNLFFIFKDLFALMSIFTISLLVLFPRWLQMKFGISEETYYQYSDYRFDFYWNISSRVIKSSLLQTDNKSTTENFLLAYEHEQDLNTLNEIYKLFAGNIVNFRELDEEVLRKLAIHTHDIFFLSSNPDEFSNFILDYIEDVFHLEIQYANNHFSISGGYEFNDPNFAYAFLAVIPPYWNLTRKIWFALASHETHPPLIDLIANYKEYFTEIASKELIFAILKFKKENWAILPIPPISPGLKVPDPSFIKII